MARRNQHEHLGLDGGRPYQSPPLHRDWKFLLLVAFVLVGAIGICLLFPIGRASGQELTCNTRPYAGRPVEQLPCLDDIWFDGVGVAHLTGVNPGPDIYTAAVFHVPDPNSWWTGQTLTVSVSVPAGPFDLELPCQPGAAQADLWLDVPEAAEEAYTAATTDECDRRIGASAPDANGTAPAPLRGDDTPTSVAAEGDEAGVGGEQGTTTTLAVESSSAPTVQDAGPTLVPAVQVAGVVATRAPLAHTGASDVLLIVAGVAVILVGSGIVHLTSRKVRS